VLFFMTLAILVFNFYPLTAVMIVMLALLNDGAILSIAYDNVQYKDKPEAWNMRLVLAISTVLGLIGVVSAFGLFYLGERVFHFDRLHVQTLMYLKLSVAGHLTIFLTRTRGPFWSIRPARILWIAVLGTQTIATLLAVFGVFMAPLGWKWAAFVWGYALVWALVNDRVKLLAYKIFDPVKAEPKPDASAEAKPEAKGEPKPEAKAESKPEEKAAPTPEAKADEPKPEVKVDAPTPEAKGGPKPEIKADTPKPAEAKADEPKPEAKTASDLKPQIAKRAYELYGERAGNVGTAVQDWKKAEQEIRNDEAKSEPKREGKVEPEPETKADAPAPEAKCEPKPEAKVEPEPEAKADAPTPEAKAEPKPVAKVDEPKPEAKADRPKPEAKDKTQPDVSPELVKRVHEFYEELGRKDVQAVQELENSELEPEKHEAHK
jgi:H+-transporting ATPase